MTNKIMFLDLENENHPYYGALASPRHPQNYVVMNGHTVEDVPYAGKIEYEHYTSKEAVPENWLVIPDDVWLLVCHNAAYEMDWFLFQQRPEIMKYLKRGGRVFCTLYAEYLLSHQLDTYPPLDETAPKYGGTHKIDAVKILWEQGKRTSEIDPALLAEYLAGPEGDVANTRLTFYGQYTKALEQGMWPMILERMEGLVFNCLCMDAGLKVDRVTALRQRDEQEARLAALTAEFEAYRSHIPEYVQFKPTSDYHMSAWLFGGPIKYVGKVQWLNDDGSPRYEKADFVKLTNGSGLKLRLTGDGKIETQLDPSAPIVLVDPEVYDFDVAPLERYKSGKNKGNIKVFREDTNELKYKNADLIYNCPALVDLKLLSPQVYKEFMREFSGKRVLADDTPEKRSFVISTGKDCLDMLALREEFSEELRAVLVKLQEHAKIDKDAGTYYLREVLDDEGKVVKQSGMLKYLTDKDVVHHTLNVASTITSRLSSNNPNFQNLPRGDTSEVKKMFVSRFGREGFIIEADYTALEVVTQAAFSNDANLCKALMDGVDMHCLRLASDLGEPYEEVLRKAKNEDDPDFPVYGVKRTKIKPKAFAYQYGATAAGIAFATGCTVEEAQAFIDNEKRLFPDVEKFYDDFITPAVEANGTVHREQMDNGNWRVYKRGHWQAPGGTCYSFRQYEKKVWADGQSSTFMQYKPTQIRNYPIQGESGFFVQVISGLIMRWLIANDFFSLNGIPRVYAINTVHDAYYFDCHWSVLDEVCAEVKRIMESLPTYMNTTFAYDLKVPFPAAVEFGNSMFQKIHWHPGVLNEVSTRQKLGWDVVPQAEAA